MMKIIGIVIIAISVILYSISYYKNYKARPCDIGFFINLIKAYNTELFRTRKSMIEILSSINCKNYKVYIDEVNSLIANNTYYNAFIHENRYYNCMALNNEDKVIIEHFFSELGRSGIKKEIELCSNTLDALIERKKYADSEFKKIGPLSIKLGVALSIWVAILLI